MSNSMVRVSARVATVLALAVALSYLALPAFAKATKGTASITTVREFLAGTSEQTFTFQVDNPAPSGPQVPPPLDLVQIIPPRGQFTPVNFTAPAGWTGTYDPLSEQIIFQTTSAVNEILTGRSQSFTFTANVGRPATDIVRSWKVSVSDNGGQQLTTSGPASAGALTTTTRVLRTILAEPTAPAQALDYTVTSGQGNVKITSRVQNAGSGTLTVTPSLVKLSGSSTASCAAPAAKSMAPRTETTFVFTCSFGAVGNIVFTADAAAPGADAFSADTQAFTIDPAAVLSYAAGSLTPSAIVPGQAYSFQVGLRKQGSNIATINKSQSTFTFAGLAPVTLASPDDDTTNESGSEGATAYTFNPLLVSTSVADGSYAPTVRIVGTDVNGAAVSQTIPVTDLVLIDRTAPDISPTISVPASNVQGEPPAAGNGRQTSFGGTIQDPAGTPCGSCAITGAELRQFAGGAYLGAGKDIAVTVTNSNGALSGSYSGDYDPAATAIQLVVTGTDTATNGGSGISASQVVDVVAPAGLTAVTGGGTNNRRLIVVTLTERVTSDRILPTDFTVDNHTVLAAAPAAGQTLAAYNQVVLTLGEDLGRNEKPTVQYSASPISRAEDRVAIQLADFTLDAIDGIVPGLPTVDSISGLARQDGEFFTNDSTPDFAVSSVNEGDMITVYRDVNNNGTLQLSQDEELGSKQVAPGASTVTVTSKELGTVNRRFNVLVRAVDPTLNPGQTAVEPLNLDFLAPRFLAGAQGVSDVTVTFDEVLVRGRDFAVDWVLRDAIDTYPVAEVAGAGNSRLLTVDDPSFTESTDLTGVVYSYKGPAGQRYQDRAGNDLPNFLGTF